MFAKQLIDATPAADTGRYALDNAAVQAGDRFAALSELFDAGTIDHIEQRGITSGWHCLELGGGGGSIAAWLSERVGLPAVWSSPTSTHAFSIRSSVRILRFAGTTLLPIPCRRERST